ncbi:NUDIX hydrolase domain-like protein [Xylaria sp. CBS 124048]|nr:NUDIX hydrolase domain-like protein [Xylaria sp. CBS 124048]
MSMTVTNGDHDASSSPLADGHILAPQIDDSLETAEVPQALAEPATIPLAPPSDLDPTSPRNHPPQPNSEESPESPESPESLESPQRLQTLLEAQDQASYYWDPSTMAPLNVVSAAAIARLRAYKPPPFPIWDRLPVSRRAAVLILLFADRRGSLRVVITMRAASLRNFSGHAAFPGGKADSLSESPYQIARREAWEEIGLPLDNSKLPSPFRIEPLCCLPCSLAKTELVVRPCVAFLHADDKPGSPPAPTADEAMMPRLDAKEVAAVFSAPFGNFLSSTDEPPRPGEPPLPPGHWYDGRWANWTGEPWRVHNFHVPVHTQRVTTPKVRDGGLAALTDAPEEEEAPVQRFLVWGMTGRILVDAARIAYDREPEFEHNRHYGDETLIERQAKEGKLLTDKKRKEVGLDAIREDVKHVKM